MTPTTHPALPRTLRTLVPALLLAAVASTALSRAGYAQASQPADSPAEHYVVWWGEYQTAAAIVTADGLVARRFTDPLVTMGDRAWSWQDSEVEIAIDPTRCEEDADCDRAEAVVDRSLNPTRGGGPNHGGEHPSAPSRTPQGYDFAEWLEWSVPGVAVTRTEEAIYRGPLGQREVERAEVHWVFRLGETPTEVGAETGAGAFLGPGEEDDLEELCEDECVFSIHGSGGSRGAFAGIRLEVVCEERDEPVPRVIALFERNTDAESYWDHDLAQLVLSGDHIPRVIAAHWPPPPVVSATACDNTSRYRRNVYAFGWSELRAGPLLDELLGD